MKKSLIALLVVLALIVTVSVFSVSADMEHDYTLDANNQAYCPHCDKTVTFTAYSSGNLWSSHYYLTGDLSAKAFLAGSNAKAVIHLNGHTVSNTSRVFNQYNACELYIIGGGGTVQTSGSHDAIYANHSGAKIHLYDVNVVRANKATADTGNGGAVKVNAGGAIYMHEGTTIQNLTTTSATGGAVQVANGTFEMDGGTISNCSSTVGGAVYLAQGTVNIKGGTISGCQSTGTASPNGGGAIYATSADSTVNISGGTIDGCFAAYGGGAVLGYDSAKVNVSGTAMIKNCYSKNRGGAIMMIDTSAKAEDFAKLTMTGGTIQNCYLPSNSAQVFGPTVYLETKAQAEISGGTIQNGNVPADKSVAAKANAQGANICARSSCTVTVSGTANITGGNAGASGLGGNVFLQTSCILNLNGGTIQNGTAQRGGGVYVNSSKLTVDGGTITGCKASDRGGSVAMITGTNILEMKSGKIQNGYCWGNQMGGNIYAENDGVITIEGGTISGGNTTDTANTPSEATSADTILGTAGRGGNICVRSTVALTMTGGTVSGGIAPIGGNISLEGTGTHTLSGGTISGGAALMGGNICVNYNTPTVTISGTNVTGGTAFCLEETDDETDELTQTGGLGGNIYHTLGTVSITGGQVQAGKVKGVTVTNDAIGGGNIYTTKGVAISGTAYIYNGQVDNCAGGNIYNASGETTISGGEVYYGIASATAYGAVKGGDIYNAEGATVTLSGEGLIRQGYAQDKYTRKTGEENAVQGMGGCVYNAGTFNMNGGTIKNGFARRNGGNGDADGGNIYNVGAFTVTAGSISGGSAFADGGNVYLADGTFTLGSGLNIDGYKDGAEFTNAANGGNIYYAGGTLNLPDDYSIKNGKASANGGNIYLDSTNLTISAGSIEGGKAALGAGVYVNNGALEMTAGELKNNTATGGGAGVFVAAGTGSFTLTDGTLDSNKTTGGSGGTIRTNGGAVTISGGIIKNGESSGSGGNLFCGQPAVIKITGGTFSGGKAANGGNISLGNFGDGSEFKNFTLENGEATATGGNLLVNKGITLGGNVTITGGTAANGGNLYNTATVYLGTDENEDGVADGLVTISNGTAKANANGNGFGGNIYATAYVKIYNRVVENEVVTAGTDIFGGIATYYHAVNDAGDTITIKGGGGGNIYTTANQTIPAGYGLTGGKAINGNGGNIYVAGGTTLLNADAVKDGEGKVTGYENLSVVSGGTALRETVTHTPDGAAEPTATNAGTNGMGGNIYVAGGVLDVYANITSDGTVVAQHGGNVFVNGGEMKLHTGEISGGKVVSYGGNIYVAGAGKLTATGGVIKNGVAEQVGGNLYVTGSGASSVSDVTITKGWPQSIYMAGAKLTLKDTTVSGCTNTNADGAVLVKGGELVLNTGATISGNDCRNVYIDGGTVTMNGGQILANADTTVESGHNVYLNAGNFNMNGGAIKDGVATVNGGNVYIAAGTFDMKGGSISGGKVGTAKENDRGGNVYVAGGEFKMSDDGDDDAETKPEVKDGTAYNGGNIFANAGKLNIAAGTISNTKQANRGGNISIYGGTEHVMSGGEITGGKATAFGGNVYMQGGSMLMTGGKIKDGSLDGTAAVGSLVGGNIAIRTAAASFTLNCTTEDDGIISGGVALQAGNVHIDRGRFTLIAGTVMDGTSNTGANINVQGTAEATRSYLDIQGGLVSGGNGTAGSIRLGSYGNFSMSGGEVTGGANASANGGGNIYQNAATAVTTITGGKITDGKATAGAGGNLWINAGSITLANATVSGGEAATTGGNVFISASATIGNYEDAKGIQNVKFDGGEAGTTGGNVHINKVTTFTDCKFFNGVSGTHGGNLYVNAANTNITGCHFSGGVAGTEEVNGRGGNLAGWTTVNVSNTTFEDGVAHGTSASYLGGGNAYVQAASTFENCTFNDGVAENGYGGNLACHGAVTHTFTDCVVEDGTALRGGNIHLHRDGTIVVLDGNTVVDASDEKTASESNRGNNICVNVANAHLKIKGNTIVKNGNGGSNPSIDVTYGGFLTVSGNAQVDKTLMKASYTTANGVTTAVAAPTGLTLGAQNDPFNGEIAVAWQYHYIDGNAVYTNGVKVIPYEDVENHNITMTNFGTGSVIVYNNGGTSYPTVYDNGTLTIVGYTGFVETGILDENDNVVYKEVGLENLNGIQDGVYAYIKLYTDLKSTTEITLTSNTPFDLNNRTAHFITGGDYNVNVIDYRSDGGVTTNGKFTTDNDSMINKVVMNPVNDNQYLSVKVDTDKDGVVDAWTANRIKVALEKVSIRPKLYKDSDGKYLEDNACGIYYTANILTNSNVAPYLTEYGVAATADPSAEIDGNFVGNPSILYTAIGISTTGKVDKRVTSGMLVDVMTTSAPVEQNEIKATANVDAKAYVTVLVDGEPVKVLSNESKPCTMKGLMQQMDENFAKLNPVTDAATIKAASGFYDDYYSVMQSWGLVNLEAHRNAA